MPDVTAPPEKIPQQVLRGINEIVLNVHLLISAKYNLIFLNDCKSGSKMNFCKLFFQVILVEIIF